MKSYLYVLGLAGVVLASPSADATAGSACPIVSGEWSGLSCDPTNGACVEMRFTIQSVNSACTLAKVRVLFNDKFANKKHKNSSQMNISGERLSGKIFGSGRWRITRNGGEYYADGGRVWKGPLRK